MSSNEQWISSLTDKSGKRLLPIVEDMAERDNAVLICNFGGDDRDAQINEHLLQCHCEPMLLGLKELAKAGGCTEVILYGGGLEVETFVSALASRISLPVTIKTGISSPVLREETALYSVLDTGVIRVNNAGEEYGREYLSCGYEGKPTLVVDGESAYQAGRLFEDPGTPITKHIAVIGADTEIKEVNAGTAVASLLGDEHTLDNILIGGTCGSFLKCNELAQTQISFSYQCDSLRIFADSHCVINEMAELYRSIKDISCSKCVLCREGSWQLHAIFSDITKGKAVREDMGLVEDICSLIHVSPICSFGKNMVLPAMTAATICKDELTEHVIGRKCTKGQCEGFVNYVIDPAMCSGCEECLDICPEEAIDGKGGFIHIIDEKLCSKCGKCVSACPEGAIKCGGEKIKTPKRLVKVGKFH